MSTDNYQRTFDAVIQIIKDLTPEEQIKLIDEVKSNIQSDIGDEPLHDIMEFKGFAKDLWKDVDVEEYIRQERAFWGDEHSYHNDDTHSESDKR